MQKKQESSFQTRSSIASKIKGEKKIFLLFEDKNITSPMIIWGNTNHEEGKVDKLDFTFGYKFLNEQVYCYNTSETFRSAGKKNKNKNVLFILDKEFSDQNYNGKTNLEWLNQKIKNQVIRSRGFFLTTTDSSLKIEILQKQYHYLTQICMDDSGIQISLDKMLYNRIFKTIEKYENMDFYFGNETINTINNFKLSATTDIIKLFPTKNKIQEILNNLKIYVKYSEMRTPLVFQLTKESCQELVEGLNNCKNNADEQTIVTNILELYTKETNIYKILNNTLNTMNLNIYGEMKTIYQLFSLSLQKFNDENKIQKLELFRGSIIQKYQYQSIYFTYTSNKSKGLPTHIVFPQFTSTTLDKGIAYGVIEIRQQEAQELTSGRLKIQNNKTEQSQIFGEAYDLFIKIDTNISSLSNPLRPKNISQLAHFENEKEFLFQPFQKFEISFMTNPYEEAEDEDYHGYSDRVPLTLNKKSKEGVQNIFLTYTI